MVAQKQTPGAKLTEKVPFPMNESNGNSEVAEGIAVLVDQTK